MLGFGYKKGPPEYSASPHFGWYYVVFRQPLCLRSVFFLLPLLALVNLISPMFCLFLVVKRVFVGSLLGLFGCLSLISQSVAALP